MVRPIADTPFAALYKWNKWSIIFRNQIATPHTFATYEEAKEHVLNGKDYHLMLTITITMMNQQWEMINTAQTDLQERLEKLYNKKGGNE